MATFRIGAADIDQKTIAEIFAAKGYLKETPALISAYDETAARYFDWRAQYGAQFSAQGTGFYTEDPNSSHRNIDWSRKDVVVLSTSGGTARLVNDESILTSRTLTLEVTGDILGTYLNKAAKSNRYDAENEVKASQAAIPKGLFSQLPVHAYILMFHLELHHYLWVHVDDMTPYQYQPALKQKLILPQEQTDLIDILTAEMDVLMDDIVAGKSEAAGQRPQAPLARLRERILQRLEHRAFAVQEIHGVLREVTHLHAAAERHRAIVRRRRARHQFQQRGFSRTVDAHHAPAFPAADHEIQPVIDHPLAVALLHPLQADDVLT